MLEKNLYCKGLKENLNAKMTIPDNVEDISLVKKFTQMKLSCILGQLATQLYDAVHADLGIIKINILTHKNTWMEFM